MIFLTQKPVQHFFVYSIQNKKKTQHFTEKEHFKEKGTVELKKNPKRMLFNSSHYGD